MCFIKKMYENKFFLPFLVVLLIICSFINDAKFYGKPFESLTIKLFTCKIYFVAKILYLIFVICILLDIRSVVNVRCEKLEIVRKSIPLFIVYMIFFFILYPGIWYGDEMQVITNLRDFEFVCLQGAMVTIWDMVMIMIFPTPATIQLVLVIIMSLSCGMVKDIFDGCFSKWVSMLAYVPFLLFPVIYFLFYSHRSSTIAIIEVFCVVFIIWTITKKKIISWPNIIILSILIGMFYGFRNETIMLEAGLTIIVIFKLFHDRNRKKFLSILIIIGMILINEAVVGDTRDNYSWAYMINTLPLLVQSVELKDNEYEAIDNVIDVSDMKQWDLSYVNNWAWEHANFREYTSGDFINLRNTYFKLIFEHPKTFLYYRYKMYSAVTSTDDCPGIIFLLSNHHEFYDEAASYGISDIQFFKPINNYIRCCFANGLLLSPGSLPVMYRFFYTLYPSILGLALLGGFGIHRKKFTYLIISGALLLQGIVIFFAASEATFMYWLPIYYVGIGCLQYFICIFIQYIKECKYTTESVICVSSSTKKRKGTRG